MRSVLSALIELCSVCAAGEPERPIAFMTKAAPHWILRNAWMAKWVLQHSAATLHDETGLRPLYYNASGGATTNKWRTVTHGACSSAYGIQIACRSRRYIHRRARLPLHACSH